MTHDCPVVHRQAMHQRRSRMASTVQLTYTSAVKLVAGEAWLLCTGMQPINTVSPFLYNRLSRDIKHSSADEVTAGYRATCENHSIVAASAGSQTRVQQALDDSWAIYCGVYVGDALKTGRVTGTLLQLLSIGLDVSCLLAGPRTQFRVLGMKKQPVLTPS